MQGFVDDPDSGRLHIERLSPKKSWTKEYENKVAELALIREENYVPPERKNLAVSIAMGSVIAKRLGKHVRRRLRDKKYMCRRSIDNLTMPRDAQKWNPVLGTQLICDICGLSALFDCTSCRTCNSIAHRLCVGHLFGRPDFGDGSMNGSQSYASAGDYVNHGIVEGDEDDFSGSDEDNRGSESENEEKDDRPANISVMSGGGSIQSQSVAVSYSVAVGQDAFICGSCRLNTEEDLDYHDRLYSKLQGERRYVLACRVVARRILAYVERARFKKLKKGLVLIQSCIRKRRAKKWLFFLRRNMLRIVILDVMEIPFELRPNDMICVTTVDPMKHGQQLFRFDKTAEVAKQEGFFISGITAMMTLVITVLRPEEHTANTSYFMMQQAQLAVRDGDYNERRTYNLTLSKVISWIPQDTRGDFSAYQLKMPPDRSKGDKMLDNDKPWLKTDIIVQSDLFQNQLHGKDTTLNVHEELQYKQAQAEEKRLASLGLESKGHKSVAMPAHLKHEYDLKLAAESKARSAEERYWNQFTEMTGKKLRMFYQPLNPCSSVCFLVSGPPLEELRKPPETDLRLLNKKIVLDNGGEIKLKTIVECRTSIWWFCLCYLRLYFFQYHGDCRPRLVASIVDATVEISPEYANKSVVNITMADKRSWLVEFEDFKKAQRFEFAVKESQEGHRKEGGSIFVNTKDVRVKRDFGNNQQIY